MGYQTVELEPEYVSKLRGYKCIDVDAAITAAKARKWLEQECIVVDRGHKTPFNCYHVGFEVYARIDGQPVTDEDFAAMSILDSGQSNKFTRPDGTMRHDWICDSGD